MAGFARTWAVRRGLRDDNRAAATRVRFLERNDDEECLMRLVVCFGITIPSQ